MYTLYEQEGAQSLVLLFVYRGARLPVTQDTSETRGASSREREMNETDELIATDAVRVEKSATQFETEDAARVAGRAVKLWGQKSAIQACLQEGDYFDAIVTGPGISNYGYFKALESKLGAVCPELLDRPLDVLPAALEIGLVQPYVTVIQEAGEFDGEVCARTRGRGVCM